RATVQSVAVEGNGMHASTARSALAGKRCLIIGAASGIGAAVAGAFAEAGGTLALADRDVAGLTAPPESPAATTHVVDITDPSAVRGLTDAVVDTHGGVDVLVNCAGVLTEAPLVDMDLETWQRMIDVDLTSVFLTCRA